MLDKEKIEAFLLNYFKIEGDYTISDEGVVDVVGNLKLIYEKFNQDGFTELPIQFGHIKGIFYFENTNITTMKGFPHTVNGYCSIDNSLNLKLFDYSIKCKILFCGVCLELKSLDGLNCEQFIGNNLNLKRVGNNFYAKYFNFNKFPTPTADEMRRFIELNPKMSTQQEAPWITLIKDYNEHKDMFKAITEFEELYNEPWIKPENRIEIINSDLTMVF